MKKFGIILLVSMLTITRAQLFTRAVFDSFDDGNHPSEDFDDHPGHDFDAEEEESFTEDDDDEEAEDYDFDMATDMDAYDAEAVLESAAKRHFLAKRKVADKDFIQTVLDLSNKYRAKHGAPALTLDDKLNEEAQAYADHESATNVQKHSCGPCDQYGENLAYKASTGDVPTGIEAAKWAVNSWYDEVSLYPFDNPGGGDMHKWGHFTALVWKSSSKMGVGVAYGTKKSKKGNEMKTVYVVARYLPPGNMLTPEAMKENVLPAQ